MNPFDFVKSINDKTGNLIDGNEDTERQYNPFIVNRSFSNFADTVLCANTMNQSHHLSKKMQYDYLYNCVKKKHRFSKWHKIEENESEEMIMNYYKVSRVRAKEYLTLLTEEDITHLKKLTYIGGSNK